MPDDRPSAIRDCVHCGAPFVAGWDAAVCGGCRGFDDCTSAGVLLELAHAGCNTAEIADYLATRRADLDVAEWAEATDANERTVRDNAASAAGKLR